jgi:hypothetical protein
MRCERGECGARTDAVPAPDVGVERGAFLTPRTGR